MPSNEQYQESGSHAVTVIEKRSTEGRQRPYRVLRTLAKVFTIFAPILSAVYAYNSVAAWFIEEGMHDKALVSVKFLIEAILIYLFMKAAAQMIYLVFDIARGIETLCKELEG